MAIKADHAVPTMGQFVAVNKNNTNIAIFVKAKNSGHSLRKLFSHLSVCLSVSLCLFHIFSIAARLWFFFGGESEWRSMCLWFDGQLPRPLFRSRGAVLITNLWFIANLIWVCLAICLHRCIPRCIKYNWWFCQIILIVWVRCDRC